MTTAEDAIRARRRLTNRIIAERAAARLRPFLHPEVKLIVGDGTLVMGVGQVIEAFTAQFGDPEFAGYVRTTDSVCIDQDGLRGAESGRWVGSWTRAAGPATLTGAYMAVWRKSTGQWVIESELYVSLAGDLEGSSSRAVTADSLARGMVSRAGG